MTIHVLHAGDGYLYLIRTVAAHDGRLRAGESLAAYYTASGQPPGRWSGRGAARLGVSGLVSEQQMRNLFGDGLHPDADQLREQLVDAGSSPVEADRAVRLGRRFPRYQSRDALGRLASIAYRVEERRLGRPLSEAEMLTVRQQAAAAVFTDGTGRAPLDPVELTNLGTPARAGSAGWGSGGSREAVAGYDFVFTPVKSVSVLWGIGSARVRQQIFEAHTAAVADTMAWLEAHVALTRSGNHGEAQVNTLGVIAAMFDHWDSRAGDPDLHTHVAVSNKVQGVDGKWRSLDGRVLFAAAVSMSERYNTAIEDQLRTRLGAEFAARTAGGELRSVRELSGMPEVLVDGFSKRRHGIEQQYQGLLAGYRRDHGRDPAPAVRTQLYQQATLSQRPEKVCGRSLQQMVDGWQAEADRLLATPGAAVTVERQVLGRGTASGAVDVNGLADRLVAVLAEGRATWNVHHVRAEAHRLTRPYPTADRDQLVEQVVTAALAPARVLRIETPRVLPEPAELRRADGESVFIHHGSTLFTTTTILDAEDRIVTAARSRGRHGLDAVTVAAATARAAQAGVTLTQDQAGLVAVFCRSPRALVLGLAPAGTGKTTAMRVTVDAWLSTGRPVVALAPSAAAADVLAGELGVPADTLAKFDHDQPAIVPGTMLLVDEAGMAGTLILDRVITRTLTAGGVVRLLGDDRQLAAVEAGGVLRQLDHTVGAVRMGQVLRFTDPEEAAATLHIRAGDPAAVAFYLDRDRITAGTTETAPEAAYQAWLADIQAGRDSLLLAASTAMVAELNGRARADLVCAGHVGTDGVSLHDGTVAAVGDRVCTRRNQRRLLVHDGRDWVKNGDSWTVLAVGTDGSLAVEHRRHHGRVVLPADYVTEQVELDYARTIHRAQGMTVDLAHLVVDPRLAREDLYVGVSRARHGTRIYVATMTHPEPDHHPDNAGPVADVLAAIIGRTRTEPSASEAIRDALAQAGDVRRLAVEYEYALGVHVADRYRTAAEQIHPGITNDPAWPTVAHRLHQGEAAGWTVDALLRRADQMGGYADVHNPTQVLVYRLDILLTRITQAQVDSGGVPVWLAPAPPPHLAAPWDAYLPARHAEIADRIGSLAAEAEAEPAPWLTRIGDSAGRERAIRHVVAYRTVYQITDRDPVGPEPDPDGRQHQAWTATRHAITASHPTASPGDPAPESAATRLLRDLHQIGRGPDDDPPTDTRTGPTLHL